MAGNVITGDALYCQRDYCQQLLDAGGDYLVIVKKNQRELYDALPWRLRSRCGEPSTGRPGGGAVTGIAGRRGSCGLRRR